MSVSAKYQRVDLVPPLIELAAPQTSQELAQTLGMPDWTKHWRILPDILQHASPVDEQSDEDDLNRALRPWQAVVIAQVQKIEPFYQARPGQFPDPLNFRQSYHVRELKPEIETVQWGWTYHMTAFGLYARNLSDCVQVGDYMVVQNPSVVTDPHPDPIRGHSLTVWVGPTTQLAAKAAVIRLKYDGPLILARSPEIPIPSPAEDEGELNLRLEDEDEAENVEPPPPPTKPKEPAKKPEKPPSRIYVCINDCTSTLKKVEYNVWAVITRVSRPVSATRGRHLMAQVFIQDPECTGTYGFADYQFSLLGTEESHFPPLEVGYVIRIHHMVVQEWNGAKNGRVYDARSVLVVPGGPDDPIEPICRAKSFEFTTPDLEHVKRMRSWWQTYQNLTRESNQASVEEKRFEEISQPGEFDIYCQVLSVETFETSHGPSQALITVTDGTRNSVLILVKNPDSVSDQDTQQLAVEETRIMEVTVFGHEQDVLNQTQVGEIVLLKRVQAHRKALFDTQEEQLDYGYFFTIPANQTGAKCLKIHDNHSQARAIRKRINAVNNPSQHPPQQQEHSEDMRSVEELMEELHRSPGQPISSQDTTMFPNSEVFQHVQTHPSQESPNQSHVERPPTTPNKSKAQVSAPKKRSASKTSAATSLEQSEVRCDEDLPSVKNFPVTENDLTLDGSSSSSSSSESSPRPVVTRSRKRATKIIDTKRPTGSTSKPRSNSSDDDEEDVFYSCPSQL